MDDLISRQAAIDEIEYVKAMKRTAGMTYTQHLLKNWRVAFHALNDFFAHFIHGLIPAIKIRHHQPVEHFNNLPSVQPEPSIPLSWIEKYIEWLKRFDNEFANLEAAHISVMVKKWRDEQDESD